MLQCGAWLTLYGAAASCRAQGTGQPVGPKGMASKTVGAREAVGAVSWDGGSASSGGFAATRCEVRCCALLRGRWDTGRYVLTGPAQTACASVVASQESAASERPACVTAERDGGRGQGPEHLRQISRLISCMLYNTSATRLLLLQTPDGQQGPAARVSAPREPPAAF